LELRRYLAILRRHVVLIVVVAIAAVGLGYITTPRTHYYDATSTLFAEQKSIATDPTTGQVETDPIVAAQLLALTYTQMILTQRTAALALQITGIDRTPKQLVASTVSAPVPGTTLLTITVKDRDPGTAAALANGLATAFVTEIRALQTSTTDVAPNPAEVFEAATVPTVPLKTAVKRNMELFGVFGLIIGMGLAILLDYVDVTVRGGGDAQRLLELPVLGVVPIQAVEA